METLLHFKGKTYKAELLKGKPLGDMPKSYKSLGTATHGIGDVFNPNQNLYNSSLLTVLKAKDGTFRYEIYRDGCFYPFYGKLILTPIQ